MAIKDKKGKGILKRKTDGPGGSREPEHQSDGLPARRERRGDGDGRGCGWGADRRGGAGQAAGQLGSDQEQNILHSSAC